MAWESGFSFRGISAAVLPWAAGVMMRTVADVVAWEREICAGVAWTGRRARWEGGEIQRDGDKSAKWLPPTWEIR